MPARLDLTIPGRVLRNLARLLPVWRAGDLKVMLYPAGRLTRAVLEQGLLRDLTVLGLLDRDPALAGRQAHGLTILPLAAGLALAPDLILVASTEYHLEIMRDLAPLPVPAVDLCQGLRTEEELLERAGAAGLRLEQEKGGVRIVQPGPPARTVLLGHGQGAAHAIAAFELLFRWLEPMEGPGPDRDLRVPYPRFQCGDRRMVFGSPYEACIFCRVQEALRVSPPLREAQEEAALPEPFTVLSV